MGRLGPEGRMRAEAGTGSVPAVRKAPRAKEEAALARGGHAGSG